MKKIFFLLVTILCALDLHAGKAQSKMLKKGLVDNTTVVACTAAAGLSVWAYKKLAVEPQRRQFQHEHRDVLRQLDYLREGLETNEDTLCVMLRENRQARVQLEDSKQEVDAVSESFNQLLDSCARIEAGLTEKYDNLRSEIAHVFDAYNIGIPAEELAGMGHRALIDVLIAGMESDIEAVQSELATSRELESKACLIEALRLLTKNTFPKLWEQTCEQGDDAFIEALLSLSASSSNGQGSVVTQESSPENSSERSESFPEMSPASAESCESCESSPELSSTAEWVNEAVGI